VASSGKQYLSWPRGERYGPWTAGLVVRGFEGTAELCGSAPRVYQPAFGAGLEPAGPAERAHPA